jgi:thiamine biosynthesis lipoprotein
VATSGHYERFVERDGVRYSHILDGRTGKPVTGMAGVTVIAPSAMWADGLSTTLFVLGPEDGARFLARHHPQAQALWIPDTPETPTLYATATLVPRLRNVRWPVKTVSVETEE